MRKFFLTALLFGCVALSSCGDQSNQRDQAELAYWRAKALQDQMAASSTTTQTSTAFSTVTITSVTTVTSSTSSVLF